MSTVTEAGPAAGAEVAPRSRRGLKLAIAIVVALLAVLVAGAAGLYAWDAGYQGRVLPGVRVGDTDLSGLDATQAAAALTAAYPYHDGRLTLRTPDGDVTIAYADLGRRVDVEGLVARAMQAGREGGPAERAVGQVRLASGGQSLDPAVVVDEAKVVASVGNALDPLRTPATDATIAMAAKGKIVTTPARAGRTVDAQGIAATALDSLRRIDAPAQLVVDVPTTPVPPAVTDAEVLAARTAAVAMAGDLKVTFKDRTWTLLASKIRSWLRFETTPDGTIAPTVDETKVPPALTKFLAKVVRTPPKSAQYLVSRSGRVVGVVASSTGRKLDAAATAAAVVAALHDRAAGLSPKAVKLRTSIVMPKLATDEAARKAPVMSLLGSWRTWFPISERNFNGANIWVPAKLINGTVLRPGQTFDWWNAIWPVTPARGFGPGGVIRVDHTEPTGALGGGMCSSSTTLFNAAMRAGLDMGARSNHRYYINRYPLGLDATVAIIGGGRQSMTFRNDMKHSVFIRGIRTRSGGVGWVTYQIWGIPEGRKVSISRPSVSNVRKATTTEKLVSTRPKGEREQVEYPSNGMDVAVTRVVRTAKGSVIHRDTWVSHYQLWNGIIEVGR